MKIVLMMAMWAAAVLGFLYFGHPWMALVVALGLRIKVSA